MSQIICKRSINRILKVNLTPIPLSFGEGDGEILAKRACSKKFRYKKAGYKPVELAVTGDPIIVRF